jgi:hypothetical protein
LTELAPQDLLALLGRQRAADGDTSEQLLAQLTGTDPTVALIASLIARSGRSESSESLDLDLPAEDEGDALELARLREISATLAAALGACDRCWGTEIDCSACRGDGSPGAFAPDPDLFRETVGPAAQRIRWMKEQGTNGDLATRRSQ